MGWLLVAAAFVGGFLAAVALNRARWSVFPLSGGAGIFAWLGNPPDYPPRGTPLVQQHTFTDDELDRMFGAPGAALAVEPVWPMCHCEACEIDRERTRRAVDELKE